MCEWVLQWFRKFIKTILSVDYSVVMSLEIHPSKKYFCIQNSVNGTDVRKRAGKSKNRFWPIDCHPRRQVSDCHPRRLLISTFSPKKVKISTTSPELVTRARMERFHLGPVREMEVYESGRGQVYICMATGRTIPWWVIC